MKSSKALFNQSVWEDNKLNTLFNTPLIGVAFLSQQGYLLELNQQFADILGYTRRELVGTYWEEFSAQEYKELTIRSYKKLLNREIPCFTYEKELLQKNGTRIWVEVASQAKFNERDIFENYLVLVKNIDTKKKALSELEEQIKIKENLITKLKYQNEQLHEFAYLISHNLRAPVGSMIGLLELNDSGVVDSKDQIDVFSEQFRNLTYSLLDTINTIGAALDIKERSELKKERIRFREIFNAVLVNLLGKVKDFDFDLSTDFELEEIEYSGSYMKNILQNLLSNSLKYRSDERKLIIKLRTYSRDNLEIMEISDNGKGINLERNSRNLFGLHKTFHENKDAKGVGLFLTKKHVEAMGGKIFAESNETFGIKFTLIFNYHENH